jgi:S-adenosylmethionine/arginine decarboxylase-like enzyme
MKNLAPDIIRRRMIIEATLNVNLTAEEIHGYLVSLSNTLGMTPVGVPTLRYSSGYGWAAYLNWTESGVHMYSWDKNAHPSPNAPFFTVDIYTCKEFDTVRAVGYTRSFFSYAIKEIEHSIF